MSFNKDQNLTHLNKINEDIKLITHKENQFFKWTISE